MEKEEKPKKYTLLISQDHGINYVAYDRSDDLDALAKKADELHQRGIHWIIEDEKGLIPNFDLLHKSVSKSIGVQ